jgi:predicted dehydrogenase
MISAQTRRTFLQTSSLAAVATALAPHTWAEEKSAEETRELICAVIGTGRGMAHAAAILKAPHTKLAYLCDVDAKRLDTGMKAIAAKNADSPVPIRDLRAALDDKKVDAVFIATCNHWHAPATIMACAAGKHVYVEKPGSHNAWEAETMVAAARKHQRTVQMGNQRRSWPALIEAVEKLRSGAIGKLLYARCWYDNARKTIGHGKPAPVPENLDYAQWQGPAPEYAYKDNLLHYNWHWHWHFGGGELANNGIHALDVARWGLGVELPKTVSYTGGRYHYDDDQETPDTGVAQYDFGDVGIAWEGSSCHPRREEKHDFVIFYGSAGTLHIVNTGYVIYDLKGEKIAEGRGDGGEQIHIENFLDCVRTGKTPNSEIAIGQTSTLLCHLGNMSYRSGSVVKFDPATRKIIDNDAAQKYWKREYRAGWEPKV